MNINNKPFAIGKRIYYIIYNLTGVKLDDAGWYGCAIAPNADEFVDGTTQNDINRMTSEFSTVQLGAKINVVGITRISKEHKIFTTSGYLDFRPDLHVQFQILN